MPPYSTGLETRQKLLQAAAEVFADQGFNYAKVSDICQLAGTNAAAVNYHFGDKEQLYLDVMKWAHEQSHGCSAWQQVDPTLPPEEQLEQFVRHFLENLLSPDKPAWISKLMAREMVEPTKALDYIIEQAVIPTINKLEEIVGEILGRAATHGMVRRCTASIIGQCVIYQHSRQVIARLNPEMEYGRDGIDELAAHVTRFSLEALRGITKGEAAIAQSGEALASRLTGQE